MTGPVVVERGDRGLPTLVLLHGLGLGPGMWRHQLDTLADRFHLLAPDQPGFGGPSGTGPFTLDSAAGYVADLIARRATDGFAHVCGFSMGSMIATYLAATQPHRVDRLVLTSNHVRLHRLPAMRQTNVMRLMPARALIRPGYSRHLFMAAWHELVRADLRPLLPDISARTLVVLDSADSLNRVDSRRVATRVPDATRRVMWNAYRLSDGAHSVRCTNAIVRFLLE